MEKDKILALKGVLWGVWDLKKLQDVLPLLNTYHATVVGVEGKKMGWAEWEFVDVDDNREEGDGDAEMDEFGGRWEGGIWADDDTPVV